MGAAMNLRTLGGFRGWAPAAAVALAMTFSATSGAAAQGAEAEKIIKAMSEYLASQQNISATYDADIEVITSQLQKIQFTSSGQLLMSRPDKLRVSRVGGYSEVELVFDGKTASVFDKGNNVYAEINAPGSIDDLVDRLRDTFNIAVPGADVLLARVQDQLMEDVIDAKYIGFGVIDGVECDHLAFRNTDTDWQLWVERGPRPIPRKYVITSKGIAAGPQYTLRIKSWTETAQSGADAFVFKAPPGAKRVDNKDLPDIDEVPPGTTSGKSK